MRQLVDDAVGEPTGPPDDRWRPVAERDHLARAARLESGRHQEEVGTGIDAAGHGPVEPLDQRDTLRLVRRELAEPRGDLGCTGTLDDQARPAGEQATRRIVEQVEALLWIEPSDHPEHRGLVPRV